MFRTPAAGCRGAVVTRPGTAYLDPDVGEDRPGHARGVRDRLGSRSLNLWHLEEVAALSTLDAGAVESGDWAGEELGHRDLGGAEHSGDAIKHLLEHALNIMQNNLT